MMSEVVDDGDAIDLRLHFEATLHALEGLERGGNCLLRNVPGSGERGCRCCIPNVVLACQWEFEVGPRLAVVQNAPGGTRGLQTQVRDFPVRARAGPVTFDGAKRLGQRALEACTLGSFPRATV